MGEPRFEVRRGGRANSPQGERPPVVVRAPISDIERERIEALKKSGVELRLAPEDGVE